MQTSTKSTANRHRHAQAENTFFHESGLTRFVDDLMQSAATERPGDMYQFIKQHLELHKNRLAREETSNGDSEVPIAQTLPWDYEDAGMKNSDSEDEDLEEKKPCAPPKRKESVREHQPVTVAGLDGNNDLSWAPANHIVVAQPKEALKEAPQSEAMVKMVSPSLTPVAPTPPRDPRNPSRSPPGSRRGSRASGSRSPPLILSPGVSNLNEMPRSPSPSTRTTQENAITSNTENITCGPFSPFDWDAAAEKKKKEKKKPESIVIPSSRKSSVTSSGKESPKPIIGVDQDLSWAPANHIFEVQEVTHSPKVKDPDSSATDKPVAGA
eukprot:gnl/MRDRNA2_/MRDRNA2_28933_c0_seq1.p1 gnl/MRDRNA2_/MRDRNA2_28933_c0~~gnl/MRDRNA2_/MRDRNA2_28933_c0_seq1.p1  ORF type:complete len:325 (-),score=58.27 gnl/MRDRNA2_/MRDRNA2_28933_c0_seq1:358-1332(-)